MSRSFIGVRWRQTRLRHPEHPPFLFGPAGPGINCLVYSWEESRQKQVPCGALAGTLDDQSLASRPVTPATPGEPGFDWAPIETDSWEKFEKAAQQATQGAARKAIDYAGCDGVTPNGCR